MTKKGAKFLRWTIGGLSFCLMLVVGCVEQSALTPAANSTPISATLGILTPTGFNSLTLLPTFSLPTGTISIPATKPISLTSTPQPSPTSQSSLLAALQPGRYLVYGYSAPSGPRLDVVSTEGVFQGHLIASTQTPQDGYLSPDGKFMATELSETMGGKLLITNLESNTANAVPENVPKTYGCFHSGNQLAWAPDGKQLAMPCGNAIYVLNVSSGDVFGIIPPPLDRKDRAVTPIWSPDGKWIAFYVTHDDPLHPGDGPFITDTSCLAKQTCEDQTRLLPIKENSPTWTFDILAWTSNSELAIAFWEGKEYSIRVYDVESEQLLRAITNLPGPGQYLVSMIWSPDGQWVAVGHSDGISLVPTKGGEPKLVTNMSSEVEFWLTIP